MTNLYLDKSLRKNCNFALIPLKNIQSIETPEEGELEPAKIYLNTIEGMMVLDSKKFIVNSKAIADAIEEAIK